MAEFYENILVYSCMDMDEAPIKNQWVDSILFKSQHGDFQTILPRLDSVAIHRLYSVAKC